MYNTTGLAVGLAIGIPTVIVACILLAFWLRQKRRYERDQKDQENNDEGEEDLDLEDLVDHQRNSEDKDIQQNGNYPRRQKVKGLRMVARDPRDTQSNYQQYYNSMIPTLPSTTSIDPLSDSNSPNELNGKPNNLRSSSLSSTTELFKILQKGDKDNVYPKPGVQPPSINGTSLNSSPLGSRQGSQSALDVTEHINSHYVNKRTITTPLRRKSLEMIDVDNDDDDDDDSEYNYNNDKVNGEYRNSPFETPTKQIRHYK